MIAKRPSIFIYTNNPNQEILREVCAGIEEEGVFYEVFLKADENLDVLSSMAANDSMLGSGIGILRNKVALHIKGMPEGRNIEFYNEPNEIQCRKTGANSARIIKKKALK